MIFTIHHTRLPWMSAAAALTLALTLASCGDDLRQDLPGVWQANQMTLGSQAQMNSSATVSVEFLAPANEKAATGDAILSAMISMEDATVPQFDGIVESYALNVAATATINGSYAILEHDEVALTMDPATLKVNVDPDAIRFSQDVFTDQQRPLVDSLRPEAARHLASVLRPQVMQAFNPFAKMDDVKIKGGSIMSCEMENRDYTFRRISQPVE